MHTHPISTGPHLQRGGLHKQLLKSAHQGAARAHALLLVGLSCNHSPWPSLRFHALTEAHQRGADLVCYEQTSIWPSVRIQAQHAHTALLLKGIACTVIPTRMHSYSCNGVHYMRDTVHEVL